MTIIRMLFFVLVGGTKLGRKLTWAKLSPVTSKTGLWVGARAWSQTIPAGSPRQTQTQPLTGHSTSTRILSKWNDIMALLLCEDPVSPENCLWYLPQYIRETYINCFSWTEKHWKCVENVRAIMSPSSDLVLIMKKYLRLSMTPGTLYDRIRISFLLLSANK